MHYEVEDLTGLTKLLEGYKFLIGENSLIQITDEPPTETPLENRIVVTKDDEERNLLASLEAMRCYIRMPDMTSTVMNVNPYCSVRWLKKYIQK